MQGDALFWTKWAAIGQLIGAAGTFAAVLTSLWIAVRSSRPRLKITCGVRLLVAAGTEGPFPELIQFSIRNIGDRDAHIDQIGWRTGRWPFARPRWLARQHAIQLFGTVLGSANPPFNLPVGQRGDALLNLQQTLDNILDRSGDQPFFARLWPLIGLRSTKVVAVVFLANGAKRTARVERGLEDRLLEGERLKLNQE